MIGIMPCPMEKIFYIKKLDFLQEYLFKYLV